MTSVTSAGLQRGAIIWKQMRISPAPSMRAASESSSGICSINLGLVNFMDETGLKYSLIMAASVISILPIFAIFLAAQKYYIGGLTAGGVKG